MSYTSSASRGHRRAQSTPSQAQPITPPRNTDSAAADTVDSFSSTSSPPKTYGSFRASESQRIPIIQSPTISQREPTRSFVYSSFRGSLAPFNSAQHARDVREDTADLASYALSERTFSLHSSSPSHSQFSSHQHTRSRSESDSFLDLDESDRSTLRNIESRPDIIHEVSEPGSPDIGPSGNRSPGTSAITSMLQQQSPSHNQQLQVPDDNDISSLSESEELSPPETQSAKQLQPEEMGAEANEQTPLLGKDSSKPQRPDWIRGEPDIEAQDLKRSHSWPRIHNVIAKSRDKGARLVRNALNRKHWNRKSIWENGIKTPAGYLPAVLLGCLLNILDALSYGMILFPLGQPIYEKLGSVGISMFYVSCIISQLVFSCGGSIFKGAIGSEMIEVVPFFHKMAFTIMATVGEDKPEAVIATTITAYAISSVLTGLVFFLMGMFKFGYIVGFIPRHILIGCIGGVGWFLVATGFEVTARLDGNLNYDWPTLQKMMRLDTFPLWLIPLVLAIVLYVSQKKIPSKYYLPTYILAIPAIFYFFVASLDSLEMSDLRKQGWIFDGPDSDEPWWYFYTLYKLKLVHWGAVAETIPAMFALTFFGVLHVPINVPALAFSVGEDHMNIDRELIAHGISNALSGFAGSIQNYLVYTNSVLFIRTGGTSRLAGIMVAIATVGIMFIGPKLIGYIPVMMVGVLIFELGFELFFEAVWDPRKKLGRLEYLTVITIVLVMGIYDFVVGIFVGIGLAFVSLVVQTSRIPAVRASYSGEIAGSTVRRNPVQHRFLRDVGKQIHVTKLAGYLFFGTIVSVETRIRALVAEKAFAERPIRYLIFDLWHVTGIDYSAAEAFNRINRIFSKKSVTIVFCGVNADGPLGLSLRAVGLGTESEDGSSVKLFPDLNSALESCENELLKAFYASKEGQHNTGRNAASPPLSVPSGHRRGSNASYTIDTQFSSPRRNHLHMAAATALNGPDAQPQPKWHNFKQPLPLILQSFQGLTSRNEDFWFPACAYFTRQAYPAGSILFRSGEPAKGFYLLEEGILRADYELPQGKYFESIVAGTTCGELPFFSETHRTATVVAERDCVVWLLDSEGWRRLQSERTEIAQELLRVGLKLTSERMSAVTSYVLTTAG